MTPEEELTLRRYSSLMGREILDVNPDLYEAIWVKNSASIGQVIEAHRILCEASEWLSVVSSHHCTGIIPHDVVWRKLQQPKWIAEKQAAELERKEAQEARRQAQGIKARAPKPKPKPKHKLLHRSLRTRLVPTYVRDFVYDRDEGRCFYCHCDVPRRGANIDHVLPVARGGKSGYANLVLSCYRCNSSKSASVLENLIDILAEVARRNREFLG
jgi:hypothetical protein